MKKGGKEEEHKKREKQREKEREGGEREKFGGIFTKSIRVQIFEAKDAKFFQGLYSIVALIILLITDDDNPSFVLSARNDNHTMENVKLKYR